MKINMKIRSAAIEAAKQICSDYGMTADKERDAMPGSDINRRDVVEISSLIVAELRKIKP